MTLMQRRRALMGAQNKSKILFEWDFTDGYDADHFVADSGITMTNDGIRVETASSGGLFFSVYLKIKNVAIPASSRCTIEYADAEMRYASYCLVSFCAFSLLSKDAIALSEIKDNSTGKFYLNTSYLTNAINLPPSKSGTIIVTYDADNEMLYAEKDGVTWSENIAQIETPNQTGNLVRVYRDGKPDSTQTSVLIRHIRIERL